MKVIFHVSMSSFSGSSVEEIFELPDDLTDEQIEKEYKDWLGEHINAGWKK